MTKKLRRNRRKSVQKFVILSEEIPLDTSGDSSDEDNNDDFCAVHKEVAVVDDGDGLETGGRSEPAPINPLFLVSSKRHCCRVSAADKGCRVYPLDPRLDVVALHSECTPQVSVVPGYSQLTGTLPPLLDSVEGGGMTG
ncbi:hypothetical protein TNCV_4170451 [Trichonephila clavipes]|nr:hypothetical protein TNCV_4170451 [Trichonephila clavipes]